VKESRKYAIFYLMTITMMACQHTDIKNKGLHFSLLSKGETNIDFNNQLTENDSVNFFTNEYMYIGSGVGVGDFNNDGLQDIYFCGSQVSSKLYLNRGDFQFTDITSEAGVATTAWCSGVSVVDINNDGLLDIYVCVSGSRNPEKRKNLLFVNQGLNKEGLPVFKEEAAEYGLADTGFSTQAVFFDYDRDGRIDMYLLNHRLYHERPNDIITKDATGNSPAADRLYHNEGTAAGSSHPYFKDVSLAAGIKEDGYGLGVVVSDFNHDGWPDIYVANDYLGNDLLWQNNQNGTFTNRIAQAAKHQSFNSMGADAADINNDGLPDLVVLDMMPEKNSRKKQMFAGETPERYDVERRLGFEPEFSRNMLQLNQGTRDLQGVTVPFFSEIGQLAGISETDWSWTVLLADLDNDGWKDMYITNGLGKDLTNNDFLFYKQSVYSQGYRFGGNNNSGNNLDKGQIETLRKELDKYGSLKINNYLFRNNHDLTFMDAGKAVGINTPSVSQGAVYADLDNDGDLDLIVNNMNQDAFVWKNELRQSPVDSSNNFLTLHLTGDAQNLNGFGARIELYSNGSIQSLEQNPVRGYTSSVDYRPHFGLGNTTMVDSLKMIWPDQKVQVLRNIKANQFLEVKYADAQTSSKTNDNHEKPLFIHDPGELGPGFKHQETPFFDFGYQRLLPQKFSQLGPALAVGDVNGDGLEDFYIGGAAGQSGKLFIQNRVGNFSSRNLVSSSPFDEDLNAVFFDADGDKDTDLLVVGGSSEFSIHSLGNRPRLYKNDGKGNFSLDESAIPADIHTISQSVAIGDFNGDGRMDLFIGGRVEPNNYPVSPRSYILENKGGRFLDVTKEVCPELVSAGMITAAVWTDFNNDGKTDLVICGDLEPVRFFENQNGRLKEITDSSGLKNSLGMWRTLIAVDIDKDGDIDFVAGNMGLNNKFHVSAADPFGLYAKDFDGNGKMDPISAYYIKNDQGEYESFPAMDLNQLAQHMPAVKKKYLLHRDFSGVTMKRFLEDMGSRDMTILNCNTTASVWIENKGHGKFEMHPLPLEAQFAPVNAILAEDFDGDGNIDLLIGGNEYQTEVSTGRYDASYGLMLKGNGKGSFLPVKPVVTGLILDGDIKNMRIIKTGTMQEFLLAAVNNDSLKCFRINKN
jgi:enediyne biosynthesis protein E4